ncbi:hypothetical protein VTJ49DRAFT_6306 [Mycothermus thermophilus]|uniref:Fork-head domain-containing protein n=1 Tax=Humicola insolens TaxID=85995 RepID=A0ABR3V1M7_HUMIN
MENLSGRQANEPFPTFDDDFFAQCSTPVISNAPMPSAPKPARQPLQSTDSNAVINPTAAKTAMKIAATSTTAPADATASTVTTTSTTTTTTATDATPATPTAKQPPLQAKPQPTASAPAPQNASRNRKPSASQNMPAGPKARPPANSLENKGPQMSQFKTNASRKPQPQPDFNVQMAGKGNTRPPLYPAPAPPNFTIDLESYYQQKPSGKRVLVEAPPIKELRPAKQQKTADEQPLPAPDEFPPIIDDGMKPNHSYATLIAMAIVRSPNRRLTLAQIYEWIMKTYSFYRGECTGWQNSIRHNLSLNKSFIRQDRPKDDPGKGSYWMIQPGMEHVLLKEKPSRKSAAPTAENMPVMSTRLEPSNPQPQKQSRPRSQPQPQQQPQQQPQARPLAAMPQPMLPPQLPMSVPQPMLSSTPTQQPHALAPAPVLYEMSSDATIPASPAETIDQLADRLLDAVEQNALHEQGLYSPAPVAMNSSPPIPRHVPPNGTPPFHSRMQPSPVAKSRHAQTPFTSMNDSGYISSLESSVMRPNQQAKLFTSGGDRPRIKSGRAEEEIARIRGSSYESPSKGRSYGYAPPSSSPIGKMGGAGQMLQPLTPAMKLAPPPRPPPSVSPSTNLRLHRQNIQSMVDSPVRRVTSILGESDFTVQTPTPQAADHLFYWVDPTTQVSPGFNIYEDPADEANLFGTMPSLTPTPAVASTGSPIKRSIRKPTGILNKLSNSAKSSTKSASPSLKLPNQSANLLLETPSKVFDGLPSSPSKLFPNTQSPTRMSLPNNNENENLALFQCQPPEAPFDPTSFTDENEPTVDLLGSYAKIGSSNAQSSYPAGSLGISADIFSTST